MNAEEAHTVYGWEDVTNSYGKVLVHATLYLLLALCFSALVYGANVTNTSRYNSSQYNTIIASTVSSITSTVTTIRNATGNITSNKTQGYVSPTTIHISFNSTPTLQSNREILIIIFVVLIVVLIILGILFSRYRKRKLKPSPFSQPGPSAPQAQGVVAQTAAASNSNVKLSGFTKQKRFLGIKIKSKPVYKESPPQTTTQATTATQAPQTTQTSQQAQQQVQPAKRKKQNMYITNMVVKRHGLEDALADINVKKTPYDFVSGMVRNAIIIAIIVGFATGAVLLKLTSDPAIAFLFAFVLGFAAYNVLLNRFVMYPMQKKKQLGREIEKDILFAARDLVISMRSGMPLFNAMTSVSTGYGAASREFAKIVELVELGMPIEQAMEDVSQRSRSKTFKRIILQASVSIKAGADITGALQSVVEEVMQERVIELRRYGQRLNALSMFYMLFGVIFPSMGIAVATILTTFIAIFTINFSVLIATLVGMIFLQVIFLNIMRSSRPTFAM